MGMQWFGEEAEDPLLNFRLDAAMRERRDSRAAAARHRVDFVPIADQDPRAPVDLSRDFPDPSTSSTIASSD